MDHKPKRPVQRRDGAGHLEPAYATKLGELSAETAPEKEPPSFVRQARSADPLAEELGESFVRAATSGEDDEGARLDAVVEDEMGGPFVETPASREYAHGTDASNPKGARREPLPKT
jgi:hypothetical protein